MPYPWEGAGIEGSKIIRFVIVKLIIVNDIKRKKALVQAPSYQPKPDRRQAGRPD
jgi:hypothetical protein